MTQTWAVWAVLALAAVAANLPFFSERLLLVGPQRRPKAFGWRLLELVLLWALTLLVGTGLEIQLGQRAPQDWQFYAATGCLFLTLASPGFVWRHLRKSTQRESVDGT